VAAEPGRLRSPWMLALTGKEPVASRPPQEGAADNEPGRVLIVAEEGQRPVQKGWRDPDLTGTIGERFRMVVLDWGSAPRLAARLAGAIRASQRETPIAVLVPCWSDLEVGAREAADFFFTKPLRVTEIRRVLALTFGSRSRVVGRASEIPMGAV
jgi:hypothetical protein